MKSFAKIEKLKKEGRELSNLDVFIYETEPAGNEASEGFRILLQSVLNERDSEKEAEMLRFAEWFGFDCLDKDKNLPNFNTANEGLTYWRAIVDNEKEGV